MEISAKFSLIFAIVAIISVSADSGKEGSEKNVGDTSLEECSKEEGDECLAAIFTCMCRQEEKDKRITADCCIKHFNSSSPESFKENMENCTEEREVEMFGTCVLTECNACEIPKELDEKLEDFLYHEKPEREEGCKEEYWNYSMKHFEAECASKSLDMDKACKAALKCEPANATECAKQKCACLCNEWKDISTHCCEESLHEENFTMNFMGCKLLKLVMMDCDHSDCNGLPYEDRGTTQFEKEWVNYDNAVVPKDKEECKSIFVEEEEKAMKSMCDKETDKKKKHICESLFACRSEE